MERKTFIEVCEIAVIGADGTRGDPIQGMRVYDTYGNGASVVHFLDDLESENLAKAEPGRLVWLASEISPKVIELAVELEVMGQPFDLDDWRAEAMPVPGV